MERKYLWIGGICFGLLVCGGLLVYVSSQNSAQRVIEAISKDQEGQGLEVHSSDADGESDDDHNQIEPSGTATSNPIEPSDTDKGVQEKQSTFVEKKENLATESVQENKAQKEEVAPKKEKIKSSSLKIQNKLVNFGFSIPSKPRTIDTIILHSSYDATGSDTYSVNGIIDQWKGYGVAPHYFIGRDGTVYQLVKDENIAYHAGVSVVPDGRTNVNDFSIGVEIANTLTDTYTDEQYTVVKALIASLKSTYAIKYVLGHDDIAPGRKSDPWNFDWKKIK